MKHHLWAATLFCCACGTDTTPQDTEISEPAQLPAEIEVATVNPIDRPADSASQILDPFMGYDDTWYISYGWPGEYPPGFAVLADGVVVMGREAMAMDAPLDQDCPLARNAVYQQWNQARAEADALEFYTASKITKVTFPSGGNIMAIPEADQRLVPQPVSLEITPGGSIGYLRYVAEGFFLMEHNGEEYQTLENELPRDTVFEQSNAEDDLWLRTNCTNGNQVWLTLKDALETEGIEEAEIQGYGVSSDLTP
ncbi:MAG: hypothetical protein AAGK23_08265 [Pseudomonadota bacterium]